MQKLFNNILVPVNPEDDNGMAIREAIGIANQWQCRIHVLCYGQGAWAENEHDLDYLKEDMQNRYRYLLQPGHSLLITRQPGASEKSIVEYCGRHEIDLILLGRSEETRWSLLRKPGSVKVHWLVKRVQCPVLTVSGRMAIPTMKHIVLPIGDRLPMRKLLFATYLARISRSTIHLVSAGDGFDQSSGKAKESLYKSYRLLRENTDLPIECLTIPGENLAEIAWDYAKKIKADLILVGAGKESLLSGFLDSLHFLQGLGARRLFHVSRIPVMTVG